MLRVGQVELSGLLAEPDAAPRALVLALHGGGMTASRSQRELFWGAESLYPPGTFAAGMRPVAPVPAMESLEGPRWPQLLPALAAEVRVPCQFTVAEHEQWWQITDAALAEYRALFTAAPSMIIRRQPGAGHNISLGWAARAYHLNALAFAEQCLLGRRQTAVGRLATQHGKTFPSRHTPR